MGRRAVDSQAIEHCISRGLYAERARLKKEAKMIDTMKANVDDFLSPTLSQYREKAKSTELE